MKSVKLLLVIFVILFMAVSQVSADTVRLYATQNAQLMSAPGADTTFHDSGITGVLTGTYLLRSIFQFELPSNLKGVEVSDAKVSLFHWGFSGPNQAEAITVNRLSNDNWSQDSVTWNSYMKDDAYGTSTYLETRESISMNARNDWSLGSWDIAADLADGDGKLTLLFMFAVENNIGYARQLYFYTNLPANPNNGSGLPDSAIVPYLELTYTPVPLPAGLLLLGPGLAGLVALRKRFKK